MRPLRRGTFIVSTIVTSAFLGFGIAQLSAAPESPKQFRVVAASVTLTPAVMQSPTLAPTLTPVPTFAPAPTLAPAPTSTPASTLTPVPTSMPEPTLTPVPPAPAPSEPTPVVQQAAQEVNLRVQPGIDNTLIRIIPHGTQVVLLGETVSLPDGSVWAKVRVGQSEGWINRRFLR